MSFFNRKALAIAALLLISVFSHTSANATYSSWNKYGKSSYQVKNYHYSYQYRNSNKYSSRQWKSGSKYYCSGKRYTGKSYYYKKHWHKKRWGYKKKHHDHSDKKPTAVNDEYSLKAHESINQNVVTENDTKGDGHHRAYIVYGYLPQGISLSSDGSLTGSTSKVGTFKAYYKLKDADGDYSKATITLHIAPANKTPLAVSDEYSIETNQVVHQNVVSENDRKGDGHNTVHLAEGALPEDITLAADGKLTGSTTQVGTFVAHYILKDEDGDMSKTTITIHVKEADIQPIAVNDTYSLEAGATLEQNIVEENDTKGNGVNTVEITSGTLPDGITLAADGSLTGTTSELGTFEVHYRLTDEDGDCHDATITIHITKDVAYCPSAAESDELHNGDSNHALWIPQISSNLTFLESPTAVRTLPSGDLVVSGTVVDSDHEFTVTMNFSGFEDTSHDPKLELKSSAYVDNGGIIDPSTWDFWENLDGTMVGTNGDFAGTTFTFRRRGPMAQIGVGASGKNQNFGFSSWFDVQIESTTGTLPSGFHIGQSLHGDINVDLPDECKIKREVVATQCSVEASADAFAQYSDGHALVLFGLGESKFVFEPAAEVRYYNTGDVEISGTTVDSQGQGFEALFVYTMRTDVGTPKRELIDSAYIDMAGPVDPSTWEYFDEFSGTLTGLAGDYHGVEIALTPRGPSAQLGDGATAKHHFWSV